MRPYEKAARARSPTVEEFEARPAAKRANLTSCREDCTELDDERTEVLCMLCMLCEGDGSRARAAETVVVVLSVLRDATNAATAGEPFLMLGGIHAAPASGPPESLLLLNEWFPTSGAEGCELELLLCGTSPGDPGRTRLFGLPTNLHQFST